MAEDLLRIFLRHRDSPALEQAVKQCIDSNAVMQLTLQGKKWCGNWGNVSKCPHYDPNISYRNFKGCNYERVEEESTL